MTSIIHRSWLVNMGQSPPPELAYIVSDHRGRRVVTWSEVLEERRQRQREHLGRIRHAWEPRERAYKLWVGYFDQDIFGGWHAFLDTYGGHGWNSHAWIDRDRRWLKPRLLEAFPLLLPLWPEREAWERWKVAFARRYRRRRQCGQPLGVAYVWWDGRDSVRPAASCRVGAPLWPEAGNRPHPPARSGCAPRRPAGGPARGEIIEPQIAL